MGTQTAMVTGASSGIGVDIARQLAKRGLNLILVARRRERLEALAAELQQHGVQALVLDCDLADRQQLNGLMARAEQWLQAEQLVLTVLVNNAGTGVWDWFENQTREVSQRDIDLNVTALTTLCHDFIGQAKAHGEPSHILNVASLAAMLPTPRFVVYSATKAYVQRFSEILDYELRQTNISVTCSCPGGVLTEFMEHAGQELKGDTGMMSSEDVARLAVQAMFAGQLIHVPGALNKLSTLVRFLPHSLKIRLVEKSMLVTVRDK
ncbi:SDR family oxidoreductase [Alcanivorax sp. 1008]|uniref:SDR family NAD(P)-dependent oxidoreductase n=1 Tax=Alcanivorax sp. 1008 TaxID=2816853 RepID=UPI001E155EB6|nr:SDR family oxidoreductase [Alcanivorax sp. 1008]MCC1495245.1 SDR family oxidoreductase [Alcanivorax sp. 1008]